MGFIIFYPILFGLATNGVILYIIIGDINQFIGHSLS